MERPETQKERKKTGGDASRGNTRTHPEHESEDRGGRWYYAGDGMGEQEAASPQNEEGPSGPRGLSSAGRAPALQAGGREFESLSLHWTERVQRTDKFNEP